MAFTINIDVFNTHNESDGSGDYEIAALYPVLATADGEPEVKRTFIGRAAYRNADERILAVENIDDQMRAAARALRIAGVDAGYNAVWARRERRKVKP